MVFPVILSNIRFIISILQFKAIMTDFRKYEDMIESTIDLKEIKNHLFLVKSSFDPDLEGI